MITEDLYRIALTQIPNVGCVLAKNLTECFGSAEQVFKLSPVDLEPLPDSVKNNLNTLISQINREKFLDFAKKEQEFAFQKKIDWIFYDSDEYPKNLKDCPDAPYYLFKKGNADLKFNKSIAIVGSRKATHYGKQFTFDLVEQLAQFQPTIVSGLAYGIDTFAHEASIQFNTPTLAVLGHGLDSIYPTQNRKLAIDIIQNGALLSEFFKGTPSLAQNFPKRNRIVAGMVDAVIIVEAAVKGGAMVTAHIANSYNKEMFAVPGRSGDKFSEGCNYLIKSQKAILLDNPNDLAVELGWEEFNLEKQFSKNKNLSITLNDTEKIIVEILKTNGNLSKEQICLKKPMPIGQMSELLFNLEMNGVLKSLPGNKYELKTR